MATDTTVWVKLVIRCDDGADAHDAVDRTLDTGELQEAIKANDFECVVVSATVEYPRRRRARGQTAEQRNADRVDGYDRDDLGHSEDC